MAANLPAGVSSGIGKSPHLGGLPGLAATAAAFSVSLGLAWILYEGVECPARRLLLRRRSRP